MPIISKETWNKFTQEEKEAIREFYKGTESDILKTEYKELFGKENLQPLTYDEVVRELFGGKDVAFINSDGDIDGFRCIILNSASNPNVCTSIKQAEKLLAINKLLNVCAWADMRNELTIEISAELTEKINGIIRDEELNLILSNDY